jgi:hypothetical protein
LSLTLITLQEDSPGEQYAGVDPANGVWYDNQLTSQLASWKNPGDITEVPQARLGWDNGDQSRNSRYLSNGAYMKLRSFMLSYDLPFEGFKIYDVRRLHQNVASYQYNDPKLVFPIPDRDMEANPNLKPQQNPGY